MSYQVIARKYRPQRFTDVVGQEHVTQTLANAIAQGRIAHAYLFVGPRGTGKTTIARIFAKCLNATGGPTVDFSDDDPRCQEITEGRSMDVLEIDGASNRGIEEIRDLRETVKYLPSVCRFKVYIIDEVHMLTKEAFNALLKTLEEPPEHVKFLFATTEAEKVLATILSRCQRFDLRRIPVALIARHLAHVAQLEKVKIDEAALYAIARGADGGMRDAESALDQLISFCGDSIAETDVLSMFGLTSAHQIRTLAGAVVEGDAPELLRNLGELAQQGKDLARLLSDLLLYFRNLLVFQLSPGDGILLEVSEAELNQIREHAQAVAPEVLSRIMEVLTEAEGRLREAVSKRIFLEVTLVRALQMRHATSIEAVLRQLRALRDRENSQDGSASQSAVATSGAASTPVSGTSPAPMTARPVPAAHAAPSSKDSTPAPMEAAGISAGAAVTRGLAEIWREVLDALARASAFTRTYLLHAHPVSLTGNLFTIGFDSQHADQMDLVNNSKTHALLQAKLAELGHPNAQIRFVQCAASTAAAEAGPAQPVITEAGAGPESPTGLDAASSPREPATPSAAVAGAPAGVVRDKSSAKTDGAKEPLPATRVEEFKNDPLIRKALEVFKGQIVDIRT